MLCADASVPKLDVIGPYGLMHYLATMRGYTYRYVCTPIDHLPAPFSTDFRSNIVVKGIEAPVSLATTILEHPAFVYQDENLTVYPLPIYSASGAVGIQPTAVGEGASPHTSKRKRSRSPPTRSIRPLARDDDTLVDSSTIIPRPLPARARSPTFNTRYLRGEDADEWRRLILQDMFPMQQQPQMDPGLGKKQKRKVMEEAKKEMETQGVPHSSIGPDKRYARLPPLIASAKYAAPSSRFELPRLGYLLVGPSVRGKFDVKKAEELGIPRGPIRARLTRGETITFTVTDEGGHAIERTVRPEDCVGPSEVAQVCISLHGCSITQATENYQAVLILDIPTPDHVPSVLATFTDSPFFSRYRSKVDVDRKESPVHAVYHYCGEGVLEDERYKLFLEGFLDDVHVRRSTCTRASICNADIVNNSISFLPESTPRIG